MKSLIDNNFKLMHKNTLCSCGLPLLTGARAGELSVYWSGSADTDLQLCPTLSKQPEKKGNENEMNILLTWLIMCGDHQHSPYKCTYDHI